VDWYTFPGAAFGTTDIDGAGPLPPVLYATLALADGAPGDFVLGVTDGEIIDPGALAYAIGSGAPVVIPALPARALPLLALLLAVGAVPLFMRSRDQ
jgi:hypothetical protein